MDDKANHFLNIYDTSLSYEERFFSLYNALYFMYGDDLYRILENRGFSRERIEDALLYARNDEERVGKTRFSDEELSQLREIVESH